MACQASPPVTIVQYDATSSSDCEAEEGLGCLVLCSSQLSPPRLCAEESGESDLGGHLEEDCEQPPSIAVLSSADEEEEEEEEEEEPQSVQQCIVISSAPEEDFADQSTAEVMDISAVDSCLETDYPLDDSWTATSTQPDLTVIPVESSSAQEDEPPASAVKRARLELSPSESDRLKAAPRKPYALKMDELGSPLRRLLADARCFFTKPHSLQRSTPRVCDSTISKAEERILCKFFFCLLLMWFNDRWELGKEGGGFARALLLSVFFLFFFFVFFSNSRL